MGDDGYEVLLEELVAAIELRETGDLDVIDSSVDVRIRRLECELLAQHRTRPGRWRSAEDLVQRLAGSGAGRAAVGQGRGSSARSSSGASASTG